VKKYTLKDLELMLDFFEVDKNTPVLLHSSLFSLGVLKDYKIDKIPSILLEFFTSNLNNFSQPAFNYTFPDTSFIDLTKPNSEVGILSNEMIKKNYFRSTHPIFSFVGNNEEFIMPLKIENNPYEKGSFFDRLYKHNGKIIVLAQKPFVMTYIIYIEYMLNVRYRYLKPFFGKVKTKHNIMEDTFYHFVLPRSEPHNHNYCAFYQYALQKGVLKEYKIGSSKAYCINAREMFESVKEYIKNDEFILLKRKPKFIYTFSGKKEVVKEKV
jgi:aminoglycoside N3'-acetyltransferase